MERALSSIYSVMTTRSFLPRTEGDDISPMYIRFPDSVITCRQDNTDSGIHQFYRRHDNVFANFIEWTEANHWQAIVYSSVGWSGLGMDACIMQPAQSSSDVVERKMKSLLYIFVW